MTDGFYITDYFTEKEYYIERNRAWRRITEGVYETAIDIYYGMGGPLPKAYMEKNNIERGFYGESEYGVDTYDVFAMTSSGYYKYACVPCSELNPYLKEEDPYMFEDEGPKSNSGEDVMEWLFKHFAEDEKDQMLIGLARNPAIRKWMVDYWDYLQDMDHNAAGCYDWLDSDAFKATLLDVTGISVDESMEDVLLYDDLDQIDAVARDLYNRRKGLQQNFRNSKAISCDRKVKLKRILGLGKKRR